MSVCALKLSHKVIVTQHIFHDGAKLLIQCLKLGLQLTKMGVTALLDVYIIHDKVSPHVLKNYFEFHSKKYYPQISVYPNCLLCLVLNINGNLVQIAGSTPAAATNTVSPTTVSSPTSAQVIPQTLTTGSPNHLTMANGNIVMVSNNADVRKAIY